MNPQLTGGTNLLQGTSPTLQGTSPNLQPTGGLQVGVAAPGNLIGVQGPIAQPGGTSGPTAPTATTPTGDPTGGTTYTTGGGGGTTAAAAPNPNTNPAIAAGIQQEYGTAINAGNALYGQNEANFPINQQLTNQTYNALQGQAQQQAQGQVDIYNQQAAGVQGQRDLSLSELLDQIRGQHQGLQSQLGAVGAGASSAAGLGDIALQHEQNLNSANINQQAGSNLADINKQISATQGNLGANLKVIDDYRQKEMQQIVSTYNQVKVQLQQALGAAQGEEKFRLGLYAQGLAQTAGDALSALDQQVDQAKSQVAQLNQTQLATPQTTTLPTAPAPAAIQSTNVSPFQISTPGGGTQTNAPGPLSLNDLLKQQQQNGAVA